MVARFPRLQDERTQTPSDPTDVKPDGPRRRRFGKKSANANVGRNAGTLMVGDIVDRGLGFVFLVVATKCYGLEIYGAYQLALAIFQIVRTIVSFGLGRSLVKDTAAAFEKGELGRLKGAILFGLTICTASALVAAGVLVFAGTPILDYVYPNHLEAATPLRVFGLLTPIFALNFVILQVFYGLGRFNLLVLTNNVVEPSTRLVALGVLFVLRVPGLIAIPLAYLCALIVSTVVAAVPFRIAWKKLRNIRPEYHVRETLAYIAPVMLNDLATRSFRSVNVFLLALFLTTEDIGVFSVALKITAIVFFFSGSLNAAFRPRIAELVAAGRLDRLSAELKATNRWVVTFALYFCGILIVFPDLILGAIGPQFLPVAHAVRILCVGLLVAQGAGALMAILQMSGHSRPALYLVVLASALYLMLALYLMPLYGVVGAATAATTTILLLIPSFAVFVQWRVGVSLYSWRLWKPIVAATAGFGVGYAVSRVVPAIRFVDTAIVLTSVALVYGGVLLALRIDPGDRALLSELLSPLKKIAKKLGRLR